MSQNEELIKLGARIPQALKDKIDKYCAGEVDGQRHIQEDVIQIALKRHMERVEKTAAIIKEKS